MTVKACFYKQAVVAEDPVRIFEMKIYYYLGEPLGLLIMKIIKHDNVSKAPSRIEVALSL
jgi:hypothetical protein